MLPTKIQQAIGRHKVLSLSLSYMEHIYLDVDSSVVLRIKKVLLGTDKDVIFISAYLPPYESSYWKLIRMVMVWRSLKSVLWICTIKPMTFTCFYEVTWMLGLHQRTITKFKIMTKMYFLKWQSLSIGIRWCCQWFCWSASQCMIQKFHMKKHIKGAAWCDDECKKAKK